MTKKSSRRLAKDGFTKGKRGRPTSSLSPGSHRQRQHALMMFDVLKRMKPEMTEAELIKWIEGLTLQEQAKVTAEVIEQLKSERGT
jgi:hypothetical protein